MDKRELSHIENEVIDDDKKLLNIPVSINEDFLGKPLDVEISNGFITNIILIIDYTTINFLELIREKSSLNKKHKDSLTNLDSNSLFYFIRDEKKNSFVLAIKIIDNKSVDKMRYTLGGILINRVKDIFCDDHL